MRRKPLLWRIFYAFLLVGVGLLYFQSRSALDAARELKHSDLESQLLVHLKTTRSLLQSRASDSSDIPDIPEFCSLLVHLDGPPVTLVSARSRVLCHSDAASLPRASQSTQPEVLAALEGETSQSVRTSFRSGVPSVFVSLPMFAGVVDDGSDEPTPTGPVIAVLRTEAPLDVIDLSVADVRSQLFRTGLVLLAAVALIGFLIGRRLSRALVGLRRDVERFTDGDLSPNVRTEVFDEFADLAASMNNMARQLHAEIETYRDQHSEQQAVLGSMSEGVVAVDQDARIINFNSAASTLMSVPEADLVGRPIIEAVRNTDLLTFVSQTLASPVATEGDIVISGGVEKFLRAHGTALRDPAGRSIGAVIVLNDITHMLRLESMRKDFVANVSHELKTPITSVRGFVQTLLDGALNDPDDARRFLEIIDRQAERLNAIIEDLLTLSRIEKDKEQSQIELEVGSVRDVITASVQACEIAASEKKITLIIDCPQELQARIAPHLLEQAVINLIANAIKYSGNEKPVTICGHQTDSGVCIEVRDQGPGIAPAHLPRIFERFYRVDRARSRKLGGTGLGLAIVKHIAQAHSGGVEVESELGEGSTFRLILPAFDEFT